MAEPEAEEPVSRDQLELPAPSVPVTNSTDLAAVKQLAREEEAELPNPRSIGRSKAHEVCNYRPPLWSMSMGDPHGQWLKSDAVARSRIRRSRGAKTVDNSILIKCEAQLREHVYALIEGEAFDAVSRSWKELPTDMAHTYMKHPSQLAPEGRDKLSRLLAKAVEKERERKRKHKQKHEDTEAEKNSITFKAFMSAMHEDLPKALAKRNRFLRKGSSPYKTEDMETWRTWLTEEQAEAWFLKVGHDNKGRMPIDVFVRRLFSGDAHVMSLEGSRDGAFPRDRTRKYEHYLWKWQGVIQKAPRFAKSGIYTPSDWEDYFTEACKILENKPEAFLKLEHVHGFSGMLNTSNNLFYSRRGPENGPHTGCLVYYAAAVGIVCSYKRGERDEKGTRIKKPEVEQKFFLKHSDDITAICMHPGREIAATGQKAGPWSSVGAAKISALGEKDKKNTLVSPVYIWNEQTRKGPYAWPKPVQINIRQKEGVSCMAFSQVALGRLARSPGDVLLTVSRDTDHTVSLWHWRHDADNGKNPVITVPTCSLPSVKGDPPQVYGCAFNPFLHEDNCHRSTFATWGKNNVMFWHYEEQEGSGGARKRNKVEYAERGTDEQHPSVQAWLSGNQAMFTTPGRSSANAALQDVLCLCYLPVNMVLVGGPNGSITVLAHPDPTDSGLTAKQELNQRRALEMKVDVKQLDARQRLKTVAVQEIQHAHAPCTRIKDGTLEGQWGIKGGGCTALVLAETWDVVFSGGGDGRIVEWQMSPEGLAGSLMEGDQTCLKMSAGVDMLTPLRQFDARWGDRTGPPRMFIGMDCCDFQMADGNWERKICAGDTENDIWEIVQKADSEEGPFHPNLKPGTSNTSMPHHDSFEFLLEGQSARVQGIAPYPKIAAGETPGPEPEPELGKTRKPENVFATACEDGNVYVFDAEDKTFLRKHEIRRHGGINGTDLPRGCNVGDLLMARACAFSPDGTMLAVSTSGVRQRSEQVMAKLPSFEDLDLVNLEELKSEEERRVWIQIFRSRSGAVVDVRVHKGTDPKPPDPEDTCDTFVYSLPRNARPFTDICIDVPLEYVERKGSFGEICNPEDVPEDLGGVIQVWYYKEKAAWTQEYDIEADTQLGPPVLLYENKVSQEAIDVLTFSPDSNLLAAGSHDNFTYVIGRTALDSTEQWWLNSAGARKDTKGRKEHFAEAFEPVGVCPRHSSYIKHVDWSDPNKNGSPPMLQTVCGAYETLHFRPELDRHKRALGRKLLLSNGESWPVCEQVKENQRDTVWDTWTSTLGFPVMGIWEPDMDGTDINSCDRSPLLKGKTIREIVKPRPGEEHDEDFITRSLSRGHLVTANDDGTVGLYHYPSVLGDFATGDAKRRDNTAPVESSRRASPHHSFRGHASHVMSVKFLSDAERVVSAGGLDRTTFQWKTHGIVKPSKQFAEQVEVRKSRTVSRSQTKSKGVDRPQRPRSEARQSTPARKSKQLRNAEQRIAELKDQELRLKVKTQQLELKQQKAEIEQLRRTLEQLDRPLTRGEKLLQKDEDPYIDTQ